MRHFPMRTLNRRALLQATGRFGTTMAAGSLLAPGLSMVGLSARSQAKAPPAEPLMQPAEIRSRNGVLDATITAAPGPVRIGDHAFPGCSITAPMCRRS
jgi:suppressor of ftsI